MPLCPNPAPCAHPLHPTAPRRSAGMADAAGHPGASRVVPRSRTALWSRPMAAVALALGVLAGCGGGGGTDSGTNSGSVPTAGTSATTRYTEGVITGFGSVIVNGVRFDDSAATVLDDSGGLRSSSALKLGMQVSVDSGALDPSTATARASQVRFGSELQGPVASIDLANNTLVVLGQTVEVTTSTLFDDSLASGLAGISVGALLEVHGMPDSATGRLVATRIEGAGSASAYKLRGLVANLDTAAKTFSIGAASISYAAASGVPSSLANGQSLRVLLATSPVAGVWQAQSLGSGSSRVRLEDSTHVHLRGKIGAFTSAASFSINGMAVDASAASFPDGSAGLALGVEVEVEGTVRSGVLVASKVEIESSHSSDDSRKIDLRGSITSVDTTAKTLLIRGVTVSYAGSVRYDGGSEAGLVAGAQVRVTASRATSSTAVLASRIRFGS